MHGRSRMTINLRIPTMPRGSMSGIYRGGNGAVPYRVGHLSQILPGTPESNGGVAEVVAVKPQALQLPPDLMTDAHGGMDVYISATAKATLFVGFVVVAIVFSCHQLISAAWVGAHSHQKNFDVVVVDGIPGPAVV